MRILGAALVLLGFLGLIFGGIPYKKTETLAEIGGLKMQTTENRQMSLPPFVSGFAILVGTALWFGAKRKPSS